MAKFNHEMAARVDRVADAWKKMRPFKRFFGMSLEDFQKILKPLTDARAELADLQVQMQHALSKRDAANSAVHRRSAIARLIRGRH